MPNDVDLLPQAVPGAVLRTRDRREARILRIDAATGTIHGEVQMHGACAWRSDGRFLDAPFGAAGPLDLMPAATGAPAPTRHGSLAEALASGEGKPFCCD
ncbi:MAG: hypothetical protein AB7F08_08090 [Dongiaceae bacterium]